MTRVLPSLAVGLLAAAAGPAFGQTPLPAPVPGQPAVPLSISAAMHPLAPATVGGRPFSVAPGGGFAGGYQSPYLYPGNSVALPVYGGYFGSSIFPYASGFYPGYPYGYPGLYGNTSLYGGVPPATGLVGTNFGPTPVETPPAVIPLQPAGTAPSNPFPVTLSGTGAATLVVSLPSTGDVWFNGVKQKDGGKEYTLTSPDLRAGDSHKFEVRAEWTADGKRYRADRTVSVSAGDRQKLTLVLGDLVQ